MDLHFSQHFKIDPELLRGYGAFDISVVSDLPLFIDPFLLFHSEKPEYQNLHASILRYLVYLRDRATSDLDPAIIANLYQFKEVRQNWLGFTQLGNGGSGLGKGFATTLHSSLSSILSNFGNEDITDDSHLEKLCLIRGGVGRDNISDFTTNLIKAYLCEYTQSFASDHMKPEDCLEVPVARARFNYTTGAWETIRYFLPIVNGDFVLLTPIDMLTRDETWINHSDMLGQFIHLPEAIPDDQLRAQINDYFGSRLKKDPTAKDRATAAQATIERFPQLIDYYIKKKEQEGDRAESISSRRVADTDAVFVQLLQSLQTDLLDNSDFYSKPWTSYEEALDRATYFKAYIENQDGYRLINKAGKGDAKPFSSEPEVQLFFGLVWYASAFDVNREANNGRGPVDFAVSRGSIDKSLIEFKLASNTQLKRNLERQLPIYEAANKTRTSVKVIVCYTEAEQMKVARILKELKLEEEESIVLIDARNDNKPSGSKA
jgi:hypothetical protein